MAGELVPLVMLPRYTTFAGTTPFYTIAMDVTEYEKAILNVWRGQMRTGCTFSMYFEESTDSNSWTNCAGVTPPVDPGPGAEAQYVPTLRKRWFRLRLELTAATTPDDFATVSCWAVGFLERRES
ncbi:MAG: hypothetical protein K8T90_05240 [Planctomycetes bacterium]|nr:hypothetical protein [Planctomycetota bacterium]